MGFNKTFDNPQQALDALSDPGGPDWARAFAFLCAHPETSAMMLETFRDTLQGMGVEPGGTDPQTGEPVYTLSDVSKALGIPEADLDATIDESGQR
jgi:hypothetical protein